jgi:hypothetical protein
MRPLGSDANPCTVQAPGRLLPAALAAIKDGGETWMLDSANFNTGPVNITKSVSILAIPGAVGSMVGSGGDAIVIESAGVKVSLRNLKSLNFSAGQFGTRMTNGARLAVADCEVAGFTAEDVAGIYVRTERTCRSSTLSCATTTTASGSTVCTPSRRSTPRCGSP